MIEAGQPGRALRPRDAATLILLERSERGPRVLMGRRHAQHRFMPGKFVFPGGRVEPEDRRMAAAGALDPHVEEKLNARVRRPSPNFARAITPPGRVRRFDARFLIVDARFIAGRVEGAVHSEAELVELVWTPLDEARNLDLPAITHAALADLTQALEDGLDKRRPRPFYREIRGKRLREQL